MNFEYPEDRENFSTSGEIKKYRKFIENNHELKGTYNGPETQPLSAANRILITRKGEKFSQMSGYRNPNVRKGWANSACGSVRTRYGKWLSNAGADHLVQEDI
jgi:hypothetical protein